MIAKAKSRTLEFVINTLGSAVLGIFKKGSRINATTGIKPGQDYDCG